jgi:hypothetical protein
VAQERGLKGKAVWCWCRCLALVLVLVLVLLELKRSAAAQQRFENHAPCELQGLS